MQLGLAGRKYERTSGGWVEVRMEMEMVYKGYWRSFHYKKAIECFSDKMNAVSQRLHDEEIIFERFHRFERKQFRL